MNTGAPDFAMHVDQNRYLNVGSSEVHAVVTVEATRGGGASPAAATTTAEVIIVDASGSMYGNKIAEAKRAAKAAIDALRDGVYFAIVAGTGRAAMVYPRRPELALCTPDSRAEAAAEVGRLEADGGTAMGEWLSLANRLFTPLPGTIRHAILLTDGYNNEPPSTFERALTACTGEFVCDCRGVGTDWKVEELRKISSALLGSLDIVADPKDLEADFRAMAQTAMGKAVADVALRVWTPQGATIEYVKQVAPAVEDLTARRGDVDPRTGDYPTGTWGEESRDYHICLQVPPGQVGRQMRAGWIKLVLPGAEEQVLASGNILAEWTSDEARATQINARVAHYTGQVELADAIQEGLRARRDGDTATATVRLGRAVQLAHEQGNQVKAEELEQVVNVIDPATGTVQLKSDIDPAEEMKLDTRSTRTTPLAMKKNPG